MSNNSSMPTETSTVISVQPLSLVSMPNTVQGLPVPLRSETPSVQISSTMPTSSTYLNFLRIRSVREPIFGRGILSFEPRYQKKSPIEPKAHKNPQKNRPMIAVMSSIETARMICPASEAALNVPLMTAT